MYTSKYYLYWRLSVHTHINMYILMQDCTHPIYINIKLTYMYVFIQLLCHEHDSTLDQFF